MKDISSANFKKHAAAIHCSGELSLVERKVSNILLLNAYDDLLTKDVHSIPTKHLFAMLGWGDSHNIDGLKVTLKSLMSTIIEFNLMGDGGERWQAMTLLSSATLADGECTYSYAKSLAIKFYQPEIFAVINISIQKQFKSNYALTLYENCVRYVKVGSTGWWDLETFRKIIGAKSDMYDEFKRLSSFVIKKAIDEVNLVSDIRLEVEYQKESRKVTALRFLIQAKEQNATKAMVVDGGDVLLELKQKKLFQRLREHGIGEKLALSWMLEEPELAAKAVDYTEEMDSKGQIKGSTAGYIRRLIETHADLGKSEYVLKKQEKIKAKKLDDANEGKKNYLNKRKLDYQKYQYQLALKKLDSSDLSQFKDEFLLSEVGKNLVCTAFDASKGKFIDKLAQMTFLPWLKNKITPIFQEDEFKIWLKENV